VEDIQCVALCNLLEYNSNQKEVIMAILHVRSVPDELYQQLQQLAKSQNRSLSAQVVEILSQSVEREELHSKQLAILASIRLRQYTPPNDAPTSLHLLHEDRNR
jgi:antitoxin FitA